MDNPQDLIESRDAIIQKALKLTELAYPFFGDTDSAAEFGKEFGKFFSKIYNSLSDRTREALDLGPESVLMQVQDIAASADQENRGSFFTQVLLKDGKLTPQIKRDIVRLGGSGSSVKYIKKVLIQVL